MRTTSATISRSILKAGAIAICAIAAVLLWMELTGRANLIMLLVDVERARRQLVDQATIFRDSAGNEPRTGMLERMRHACEGRHITRLDDLEEEKLQRADAKTVGGARDRELLEFDFARDGTGAMVAAEPHRTLDAGAHGLMLSDGQVHTGSALNLARDAIATIEIEARTTAPAFVLLGWSDDAHLARMHRGKVRVDLRSDGQRHVYAIDASKALERGMADGATLQRLFLSARSDGNAVVEVTRLSVTARKQRYAAAQSGIGYEEAGGQLRRCLWQQTQSELDYAVSVPADSYFFETGIAVAGDDEPVEVEISVHGESSSVTLLKRLVQPGSWHEVRLDLGPWQGRAISLHLSARGAPGAVALWSSPTVRAQHDASGAPPILLILEDALRADRLSLYGGPVPAPAHERLAAMGTVFERAFAQAEQTRSSVPSLMTSLPPSATGAWDFSDSLRDEYVTLAEALRACGYTTASFLQNGNAGAYAGLHQGFDVVFDEKDNGVHATDVLGSKLRGWIDAHSDRPFFVYVHILDPHGPFDPAVRPPLPDAASGTPVRFDRALDPPWLAAPTAEIRRVLYDAEIAANDAALGDFWNWLEHGNLLARSVIALLADHGEYLGDGGGLWRHHPPSRLEVARVPLLLSAPGLPAGKREVASVGLIDVAPTLLDLAGASVEGSSMFGRSLAPMLRGDKPWPARALFVEEPGLERGERSARPCGSLLLDGLQLLLPCIGEDAYLMSATPTAQAPTATANEPLRVVSLQQADYGKEIDIGPVVRTLLQWRTRTLLRDMQSTDIEGWRRMTGGASAAIRSDPATSERLRGLGYAQ